jgi:hypothetical protein
MEHAVASGSGRSVRSFAIILIVHLVVVILWPLLVDAMVMAVVLLTLLGVGLCGLVLGLERRFVVRDIRLQ